MKSFGASFVAFACGKAIRIPPASPNAAQLAGQRIRAGPRRVPPQSAGFSLASSESLPSGNLTSTRAPGVQDRNSSPLSWRVSWLIS